MIATPIKRSDTVLVVLNPTGGQEIQKPVRVWWINRMGSMTTWARSSCRTNHRLQGLSRRILCHFGGKQRDIDWHWTCASSARSAVGRETELNRSKPKLWCYCLHRATAAMAHEPRTSCQGHRVETWGGAPEATMMERIQAQLVGTGTSPEAWAYGGTGTPKESAHGVTQMSEATAGSTTQNVGKAMPLSSPTSLSARGQQDQWAGQGKTNQAQHAESIRAAIQPFQQV